MENNKYYLHSKLKKNGTAYLFLIFLGSHYAYLGKWGLQILFWFTLGGFGIWFIIDLFTLSGKVEKINYPIYEKLSKL